MASRAINNKGKSSFWAVFMVLGMGLMISRVQKDDYADFADSRQQMDSEIPFGLDLSSIYKQITFAPSVGDWETKIYENNEDF